MPKFWPPDWSRDKNSGLETRPKRLVSRPRLRPRLNARHQNQPGLETDFNVFGWRAEDDGGVLFGGNGVERLEVAQLERRRRFADDVRRLLQRTRWLLLALRRYHLVNNTSRLRPVNGETIWPRPYGHGDLRVRLLAKKVKVAHTRLSSVGFRNWSRFFAVSLQVTWVINLAVGCHFLPPSPPVTLATLKRAATNFAAWWTDFLLGFLLIGTPRPTPCLVDSPLLPFKTHVTSLPV